MFKTVGFYTIGTPYEKEIKGMVESATKVGLDVHTKGYEPLGSWVLNAAIKSKFLLEMLEAFPNHDILYLDADSIVHEYPYMFDDFDADIGIRYLGETLMNGVIFLKNTAASKRFVKNWAQYQAEHQEVWDQSTMKIVLEADKEITIRIIPPQYEQIFDIMKHTGKPVISQMQASRRFKHEVTNGRSKRH